jgi:RNA polymerase sigma-70 factor (ECF subfamily)
MPANEPETTATESQSDLVQRALKDYEGALIGYAASILRDVERARDVVQDTFVKLYQQEPGKVAEYALKSWLYTVCRNRSFDVLRKEKRMSVVENETMERLGVTEDDPAEAAEREETHSEVLRFLDRLPPNQKEVIRLKFQGDMSYKEISEVTSLSVSNVGFLMHTGLKRLRQMLSQQAV